MNDPDENGWSHIHHCAFRGYVKSLDRFVENDRDLLELETGDDLRQTPFLLAVSSGLQDTVTALINLGAKVIFFYQKSFIRNIFVNISI